MGYEDLNPGIRETVRFLNEHGFVTTDSGDGKTHEYECDRPIPYVVMFVEPHELQKEADRLFGLLDSLGLFEQHRVSGPVSPEEAEKWVFLEALYSPMYKRGMLDLSNLDDERLARALENKRERALP